MGLNVREKHIELAKLVAGEPVEGKRFAGQVLESASWIESTDHHMAVIFPKNEEPDAELVLGAVFPDTGELEVALLIEKFRLAWLADAELWLAPEADDSIAILPSPSHIGEPIFVKAVAVRHNIYDARYGIDDHPALFAVKWKYLKALSTIMHDLEITEIDVYLSSNFGVYAESEKFLSIIAPLRER